MKFNIEPPKVKILDKNFNQLYILNEYEFNSFRIALLKKEVKWQSFYVIDANCDDCNYAEICQNGDVSDWNVLPFKIIQGQLSEIFKLRKNNVKK